MTYADGILDGNGVDIQIGDLVYWNVDPEIKYIVTEFNVANWTLLIKIVPHDRLPLPRGAGIQTYPSNLQVIIEDPVRFIESMPI